jgi:hypothetical protein
MAVKINHQNSAPNSSIAGIFIFILASIFICYLIIPNTGIIINKNLAKGTVYEVNKGYCYIYYINKYDGKKYFLNRKIDNRIGEHLRSDSVNMTISYSRFFPDQAYLHNLENDRSVISLFAVFTILITVYYVIKNDLMKTSNKKLS